jgi:hypothetical protein
MIERLLRGLNTLMVLNVFLVLAAFFWFAAALVGQGAHVDLGLDLWYRLWPVLLQPAIGLLMLGALISGGLGWLRQRSTPRS